MRATNRGLLLLITFLLLWGAAGYTFYRLDRAHDEPAYDLLADLIIHKRALAEAATGPRVIIAGGSNAYYGIDSQVLQERTGMPVVNFAFPFGAFHERINLHLLEKVVRPGDIVVYSSAGFWTTEPVPPESERRARGFDSYLVHRGLPDYDRRFKDEAIPWQLRPVTNTLLLAVLDSFRGRKGRSWIADTDDLGDFTGCVPVPILAPQRYEGDAPYAPRASLMRGASARLKAKGARFLVAMPWLFIHERDRTGWAAFRTHFIGLYKSAMPVIAEPPAMLLRNKRGDFCDSPLHLSAEAIRLRSEQLASALGPYLKKGAPPNLAGDVPTGK